MKRIEICGGLASGKTTLASVLSAAGAAPIFEDFMNNPFLSSFYSAPTEFAFEAEMTFLLQHYHFVKRHQQNDGWCVYDSSFVLHRSYATANLNATDFDQYRKIYEELYRRCERPEILIVLKCSEAEQIRRIKKRQRDFEQNLEAIYLLAINENIERFAVRRDQAHRVITLDSENADYETDIDCQQRIVNSVRQLMRGDTFGPSKRS